MRYPTLRRLQVFVMVAETGSFAAAARQLGISQPSVSSHIQNLEKEIAGPLFVREPGRRAALTAGGRKLLLPPPPMLASPPIHGEGAGNCKPQGTPAIVPKRSLANPVTTEPLARFARE